MGDRSGEEEGRAEGGRGRVWCEVRATCGTPQAKRPTARNEMGSAAVLVLRRAGRAAGGAERWRRRPHAMLNQAWSRRTETQRQLAAAAAGRQQRNVHMRTCCNIGGEEGSTEGLGLSWGSHAHVGPQATPGWRDVARHRLHAQHGRRVAAATAAQPDSQCHAPPGATSSKVRRGGSHQRGALAGAVCVCGGGAWRRRRHLLHLDAVRRQAGGLVGV